MTSDHTSHFPIPSSILVSHPPPSGLPLHPRQPGSSAARRGDSWPAGVCERRRHSRAGGYCGYLPPLRQVGGGGRGVRRRRMGRRAVTRHAGLPLSSRRP
eukprot:98702-Hanusia_phi.AAC.1